MLNPNRDFTILLVDDREENLLALEEMLADENRVFIKATSGNQALRHALRNDNIGLIMLDVQMPEMDGFEVARLLKTNQKTKHISIVFVTAINKEEHYMLKGFDEGAVDYLQKPLDINVTKAKVKVFQHLYQYQQELKYTAIELRRINQQLEKFAYIIAHDMKSPLTGIIGALSLLEMDEDGELSAEECKEYISHSKEAALYLANMINALLDYSRKSLADQTVEEVNVQDMVQEIVHNLFLPPHVTFKITTPLPILWTKKLKLQQVFQNLISNAVKYNHKPDATIELGCQEKGDLYEFYVQDNGPGIPFQDHENIFKFFRTSINMATSESSTGVGLSILKLLVEEQGGKIWVDSDPSLGSVFYFEWKK